ncbi:2OG-Fe(II) oxygenase [Psychrobacter sp. HD31]|uniref:2OG-Fe(II) oxygenase n=1 Tax=Psychrobacter sp. HD31 TaxID=3112003 RepID=UPI003DA3CE8B
MSNFHVNWDNAFNDACLNQFVELGYTVFDDVFTHPDLLSLQAESGFIDYKAANLTQGQRLDNIRGDKTHWITNQDQAGLGYLKAIESLARFANRTLYTGIRNCEAHYACYPAGFGYQWHSDNPQNRDERVLSAVFYLNDHWQEKDGGAIEVVDKTGTHHTLLPQANRLVVFDSNLMHQVQIAHRERFSIATWMRRDGENQL